MIINERGLVSALKKAYKRGGYTILNSEEKITIYTNSWCVQCQRKAFPVKALATIVEHMGMLPYDMTALKIRKDTEPQTALSEVVEQDLKKWTAIESTTSVAMVPIILQGCQVYQEKVGRKVYGVSEDALVIVDRDVASKNTGIVIDDKKLAWENDEESVIIAAGRPAAAEWSREYERTVWGALESVDLHVPNN